MRQEKKRGFFLVCVFHDGERLNEINNRQQIKQRRNRGKKEWLEEEKKGTRKVKRGNWKQFCKKKIYIYQHIGIFCTHTQTGDEH